MHRSKCTILSAVIATAALSSASVLAQSSPTPDQAPAAPASVQQPTDQQLQRFASASQKVSLVVEEYRPKVNAAKSDEDKQRVVQEADAKMVQRVQDDGMSVEEFNGIGRAIRQDPNLKQRVEGMVKGATAGGTTAK